MRKKEGERERERDGGGGEEGGWWEERDTTDLEYRLTMTTIGSSQLTVID